MKRTTITARFVDSVPDKLEEGILYVSEKYKMAIHKCCCGCGEEVVTPLSPVDWRLHKEGATVSLSPSIGNWSYRCKSHYWIINSQVHWAGAMSQRQVNLVKARDKADKKAYIADINQRKDMADRSTFLATRPQVIELLVCGVGLVVGILWIFTGQAGILAWVGLASPICYLNIRLYFWLCRQHDRNLKH